MSNVVRFAISLDEKLLEKFDRAYVKRKYETRSEAVRDLIRNQLVEEGWDDKKETMGTITLVFDHHVRALTEKLTSIQHDHHKLILSTMHVHLDHDHCLEVLAVKGKGRAIREVADSLISAKGVKHGKLTITTVGRELT
jgi:CopG family nickel-responsive transcriptional regulator